MSENFNPNVDWRSNPDNPNFKRIMGQVDQAIVIMKDFEEADEEGQEQWLKENPAPGRTLRFFL